MPLAATYTLILVPVLASFCAYRVLRKGAADAQHRAGGGHGNGADRQTEDDIARHLEGGL